MNIGKSSEMAQLAYLDSKEAKKGFKKLGFTSHKLVDIEGAQVHLVRNKESMAVCFRGTEPSEISDILADLKAWPSRSDSDGWVHSGFKTELDKVWEDVLQYVNKYSKLDLYICGHSLGAAMATICASRLPQTKHLYTFGSPRVGTCSFIKNLKVPHTRCVNNNDIVTGVPLVLMGYKHHGELVYINYYGNIRKMTYWQRFKDGWRGRGKAFAKGMPFDGAYDHSMVYYVRYTNKV